MKHDFHFVLNIKLKTEIIRLSNSLNKSISSTIIYIIKLVYPVLEKYYFCYEEGYNGSYEYINADSDIHVYIDEIDYRKIRQIYNNMYVFSIAKIIRWMIKLFLESIEKYGFERFLKIIQRYRNIHFIKFKKFNKWRKFEAYKHMSYNKPIKDFCSIIFSEDYILLGFEFL